MDPGCTSSETSQSGTERGTGTLHSLEEPKGLETLHRETAIRGVSHTLTEETGEPPGLVVMNDGHAQRVESHQAQHRPVERLSLHHTADGDTQETLLTPEICRWTSSGTPDARSGHS